MTLRLRTWGRLAGICLLVCALGSVTWVGLSSAQEDGGEESSAEEESEPDYVSLAGMMVKDGHYDRAAAELAKVDPKTDDVDLSLYYTLKGLIALRTGAYNQAVGHFDEAIKNGQTDDIVFVYLAQAYYHQQNWEKTVLSVKNADEAGEDIPDLYLMRATAHRKLDQTQAAWQTLVDGHKRFPDNHEFLRQRVFLLIEMELFQEAMRLGQKYFEVAEAKREDFTAVGEALRQAGQHDRAKIILEEARLRYPNDATLTVHLAHAYMASGELLTAGELMQLAAQKDKKHIMEAAELFRRAGAHERALYMNSQVVDQPEKFEQRVAILLDQRRYERIAAMESRLARLGLLQDQKILYALAYSHFKTGSYEEAESLLSQISDSELFESAVELRRAIQVCADEPWRC